MEEFELKTISSSAVSESIRKAEHYRLLSEPEQAESICRDVLRVEPENQQALVVLVLALSDQFSQPDGGTRFKEARERSAELLDEYQARYYGGIAWERRARAFLLSGLAKSSAYEAFRNAMDQYEEALTVRAPDDDNAILRWNACVRAIQRHKLERRYDEGELPID